MLGVRGFLDAPQAQGERQQAERQVDQEDALPAGVLHQQAAEQRAEDQRQRAEGGPAADHLGALAGIVESLGKDRQRAGYQQRPGDALDRASEQQQRQRGGQRAEQRTEAEQADPEQPGELATVAVAQRSGRQHEGAQAQRIGVDHPLQAGQVGIQGVLQRRQGEVDDADVERGDEGSQVNGGDQGDTTRRVHGVLR